MIGHNLKTMMQQDETKSEFRLLTNFVNSYKKKLLIGNGDINRFEMKGPIKNKHDLEQANKEGKG